MCGILSKIQNHLPNVKGTPNIAHKDQVKEDYASPPLTLPCVLGCNTTT